MDDIKMIGLKDASDATSSLPANCGMYYSIHYDLSDGQVLIREHADGNNYTSFASKSIIGVGLTAEHMSESRIAETVREAVQALPPLRRERLRQGLSQTELAQKSGVNIRQIQRVELGESDAGNLTAKNLLAIADALGVELRRLL